MFIYEKENACGRSLFRYRCVLAAASAAVVAAVVASATAAAAAAYEDEYKDYDPSTAVTAKAIIVTHIKDLLFVFITYYVGLIICVTELSRKNI